MFRRAFVVAGAILVALASPAGAQQYPLDTDEGCSVASSVASVGGTVSVSCRGYSAGATVTFTLFSRPIHLGTAVADAGGVADFAFTVPEVSAGVHHVEASGQAPDGVLVQRVTLHIDGDGAVTATPAGGPHDGALPRTGADGTAIMARAAIVLLAGGGLLLLAARKRRGRHAHV